MSFPEPPEVQQGVIEPFMYRGLLFTPTYAKGKDFIKSFDAFEDGLLYSYQRGNNYITISNSWHKACHGNNYVDFTSSQLHDYVDFMDDRWNGNFSIATPYKFEFGVNCTGMDDLPFEAEYLKNKLFDKMKGNNKTYGAKVFFTDYYYKVYSKSMHLKIERIPFPPMLETTRVEMGFKNMRYVNRKNMEVNIQSVSDLIQKDNMVAISKDFLSKFSYIKLHGNEVEAFTPMEVRLKYAMLSPEYWDALKAVSSNSTYRRERELQKKLIKGASGDRIDKYYSIVEQRVFDVLEA